MILHLFNVEYFLCILESQKIMRLALGSGHPHHGLDVHRLASINR